MAARRRVLVQVRRDDLRLAGQVDDRDITDLSGITRYRNVGAASITLPASNSLVDALRTPGYGLVVTVDGNVLFSGDVATGRYAEKSGQVPSWTFDLVSDDYVLADAAAYPSPATDDLTSQSGTGGGGYDVRTGNGEDLLRAYVDANIGPTAPASRRVPTLALEPVHTPRLGVNVNLPGARFDVLGEYLTRVATVAGLGFRVRQVGLARTFEVFVPRDLRRSVVFSVAAGTASEVGYSYAVPALTRVIVLGQGDLAARVIRGRTSVESLAAEALWHRQRVKVIDQRQSDDVAKLDQAGDEALADGGHTIVSATVTPVDTDRTRFLRDWYVGDRASVRIGQNPDGSPLLMDDVITESRWGYGPGGFTASAVLGDPDVAAAEPVTAALADLRSQRSRISRLEQRK